MSYTKYNSILWAFGLTKIPLLMFVSPKITLLNKEKCQIKIKLGYRTKNHLKSMYFGALAIGAELSIGGPVVFSLHETKQKVDFVFKDFSCQFLKRPDGHVLFCCDEVSEVHQLMSDSYQSTDRIEKTIKGYAVLENNPDVKVMTYALTLSVKRRA